MMLKMFFGMGTRTAGKMIFKNQYGPTRTQKIIFQNFPKGKYFSFT